MKSFPEAAIAIESTRKAWAASEEAKKQGTASTRNTALSALLEAAIAHSYASGIAKATGNEEAEKFHKVVVGKLKEAIVSHQLPRHFSQKNVAGKLNLDYAYQHLKHGGTVETATEALMLKSGIGRAQARKYSNLAAKKLK